MERLYELKETLMDSLDEFDTINGGELKMGELEALNLVTDTVKNIDKICLMDEEGEYSRDDGMEMGRVYDRGSSYRRGGNRGGGRSRSYGDGGNYSGNYSGRGRRRDARGRYSRADGMENMMDHIDAMMDEASTPEQRQAIERLKRQMENA